MEPNCKSNSIPKKIYFTRNFLYSFLIDTAQKLHTNNSKTGALFQLKLRMFLNSGLEILGTIERLGGKDRNCKY